MRVLLFVVFLFSPPFVFAQSIFINEIAWMGSSVEGVDAKQWWRYEWLELYNNADTVGMLDGWMLELYRDTLDLSIPLQGVISPRGYFLIGASDKIQNLDLNYKNLAGKFVNSGQKVVLKNSAGEIIDEVDARAGWPAGDNASKRTLEQKGVSDTPMQRGWQTSENPGGTPRAQNSMGVVASKITSKLSFSEKLSFNGKSFKGETKKDLRGSSLNSSPLFIAVPGAVLAGVLALAARRFLLRRA